MCLYPELLFHYDDLIYGFLNPIEVAGRGAMKERKEIESGIRNLRPLNQVSYCFSFSGVKKLSDNPWSNFTSFNRIFVVWFFSRSFIITSAAFQ